jgi:DNA-binding FadR family transcriptional regulator
VHGQIAHEIAVRIMRGEFAPGDSLPNEDALSQAFAVSRTALREAKKVLTAKGLVASRPKLGTKVCPRREWNLLDPDVLAWLVATAPPDQFAHDLFELRRIIEPRAAQLAAERGSRAQIADIERAFGEMAAAADLEASVPPDIRFHKAILEATGNELLRPIGAVIETALAPAIRLSSALPGARLASLPLHGAVLAAIKRRRGTAAARAMTVLLDGAIADMKRTLAARSLAAALPEAAAGAAAP